MLANTGAAGAGRRAFAGLASSRGKPAPTVLPMQNEAGRGGLVMASFMGSRKQASDHMKAILALFFLSLTAALFIGYYEKMEDAYPEKVFFIKKKPTLQIEFENIFAYESDDKPLSALNDAERESVMRYCEYRLGITTGLKTQAELEACKRR
ncbi:hypothetical protein [Pseudomonas xanthosomatis]|uniref:hypothetical protein n=1 Tax=Pseudomonas xanthosomatis TaxID=2842356 RepID=UPI00351461ED